VIYRVGVYYTRRAIAAAMVMAKRNSDPDFQIYAQEIFIARNASSSACNCLLIFNNGISDLTRSAILQHARGAVLSSLSWASNDVTARQIVMMGFLS